MSKIMRGLASVAVLSCLALPAAGAGDTAANIVVSQAWSRATPGGSKVAGGYLTIENRGPIADRLLSARSDVASKVEIHDMAVNEGVMTMRPVETGLPIESDRRCLRGSGFWIAGPPHTAFSVTKNRSG